MVLLDLVMPRVDEPPRSTASGSGNPRSRVIVLTTFLDDDKLLPAVRAGAAGYLLKDVEPRELVGAIRELRGVASYLEVTARVLAELVESGRPSRASLLTPRESEVLALIARGQPNKVIARSLWRPPRRRSRRT